MHEFPVRGVLGLLEVASLAEGMRVFAAGGREVVAATWNGFLSENQDRVVVDAEQRLGVVLDGMRSASAAEVVAESIAVERDIARGVYAAREGLRAARAGTTLMGARVVGRQVLTWQSGDSRVLVVRGGRVQAYTRPEEHPRSEHLPIERDTRELFGISRGYQTLLSGTPARYISAADVSLREGALPVSIGDRVVVVSDGVTDTLTNEEIGELVCEGTAQEGVRALSRELYRRLVLADGGIFSDARAGEVFAEVAGRERLREMTRVLYGSALVPQRDNCSVVVMEV